MPSFPQVLPGQSFVPFALLTRNVLSMHLFYCTVSYIDSYPPYVTLVSLE